jgi:hypothetical protein
LANVLLGWELGEGLSHAQTLLEVARGLRRHGHSPTLALQNLQEPWPLLAREGFGVLQAPFFHQRRRFAEPAFLAASFADVLAVRGYDRVDSLQPIVEGWQQAIDLVRPALIVTDYAPTLCLAAHGVVPVVQIGSWFGLPPINGPWFPALVADAAPVVPQQEVLDVIQEVQRRRGRQQLQCLTELLAGPRFPTLLPEIDPYRASRNEEHWDPLEPRPDPAPTPDTPAFFAYLTAECAHTEAILTALALTGTPGTVYVRSLTPELGNRLRLQGLTVLDRPAALAEALKSASVLVHHGGGASAQLALAVGRPQLVFPQHLEQTANGMSLQNLGVAIALPTDAAPQAIARALARLGAGPIVDRAREWSRILANRPRRPALEAILKSCLAYLA